jgi:hypothetical protein
VRQKFIGAICKVPLKLLREIFEKYCENILGHFAKVPQNVFHGTWEN